MDLKKHVEKNLHAFFKVIFNLYSRSKARSKNFKYYYLNYRKKDSHTVLSNLNSLIF